MKSSVSVILLLCSIVLIGSAQGYVARPHYVAGGNPTLPDPFEVVCRWKQLSYRDPPRSPEDQLAGQDYYIAKNNIPTGFSKHFQSRRIFVTVPRRTPGIPSTVNFVFEDECRNGSPSLRPYPDYVTNELEGVGLISMTVDTNAYNCDDAHAYMPNLELRNLLVYSLRRNDIWTFTHPFMQPDMANANYVLDGLKFGFPDGIFSVALSPNVNNRIAFFHPLASLQEFSVPTRVLKDKSLSPDKYAPGDFKDLGVRGRQAQSATHDIDQRGVLYYTEIQTNSIKCWNTQTALKPENVGTVYEDAESLTYPNDLEIDPVGDIWAMSNRLPIFIYRGLNPDEYNFHIVRGPSAMLLHQTLVFLLSFLLGTSCAGELKEIFKWKQVYYEGIPPEITGYDNYNNVPMGVTHHKGRLFVAIPRRAPNVLSTLNVISLSEAKSTESPLLLPYPSLDMNRLDSSLPQEERFTSVYRMRMDVCDRLWFVDTGRYVTNDGSMKGHPSVVYAIDTTTDTVAERFPYPNNVLDENGASISVAVDIPNDKDCGGAFVYIPNLADGKIFVFSLREKKMWEFW
uniref:Major royal jelly protein n=2 Tax=Lutzomyia longipalpis TaxID=7200 RepID=A0A1B0GKW3_LUTLO